VVDKDQLALSVASQMDPAFDPTLLILFAQPKAAVDPAAVEKAIYEELERVKTAPLTDEELQKAKNILLADFYRQMKTINGRANTIGTYEVFFGDYHKLFEASQAYARVSKEDVQRVARSYLSDTNRTVATLLPEAGEGPKPREDSKR
jgi:predicted Zn-dependent peptidase